MTVFFKDSLYFWLDRRFELSQAQQMALIAGLIFTSAAVAYMLGSLNFSVIISRLKYRDDIRLYGSGNGGATNMLRTYGRGAAAVTLAGDMLKCVLAVLAGSLLWGSDGAYIAGLFCVVGHVFPCWHRFKGGKGVAAMAVVVLMTNPLVFIVLFAVFAGIVLTTKFVSLASIMCSLLYPIILNAFIPPEQKTGTDIIMAFLISVIVFFMHHKNMKRLLEKTEPKTELFKKKPRIPAPDDSAEAGKSGVAGEGAQSGAALPPKAAPAPSPGKRAPKKGGGGGNKKNK